MWWEITQDDILWEITFQIKIEKQFVMEGQKYKKN